MKVFRFDFMRWRLYAGSASISLVLASFLSLSLIGLSLGLDFTGGMQLEVRFAEPVSTSQVSDVLQDNGFADAVVVHFGDEREILIRLASEHNEQTLNRLLSIVSQAGAGQPVLRQSEFIGARIGSELRDKGGLALLTALLLIMGYLSFRFQYKFAIAAAIALVHDVVVAVGIFSLFRWNVDLSVLAALLAVIGYSLNDTIVISDRIRENFRKISKTTSNVEVINNSLNQTLGRTIVTSFTTLLVLFALYFFGGEALKGFALALIIGVVVGTWSSIYVAANMLLVLRISHHDLKLPDKNEDKIVI